MINKQLNNQKISCETRTISSSASPNCPKWHSRSGATFRSSAASISCDCRTGSTFSCPPNGWRCSKVRESSRHRWSWPWAGVRDQSTNSPWPGSNCGSCTGPCGKSGPDWGLRRLDLRFNKLYSILVITWIFYNRVRINVENLFWIKYYEFYCHIFA